MAITVIGVEKSGQNVFIGNPQSVTVNKPLGANDDLMVAVIAGYSGVTFSRSGWTTIFTQAYNDFIGRRVSILVKRMTNYAGEPSTFTFTASTYPVTQIVCFSLRGVYFADPGYQATHVGNDYNVTRTIPGVTTINPNAYVFYIPHWVDYTPIYGGGVPVTSWLSNTGAITDIYVGAGWTAQTFSGPYESGADYDVGFAVGYLIQAVAGLSPTTSWTRDNSYGGNSMGVALLINSEAAGAPVGGCTCNAICDNDCGSNQLCTGHVPACSNSYLFSTISIGNIVRASHLDALETAIDHERTNPQRRFNASPPAYCTFDTGYVACSNNEFSDYGFVGDRGIDDPILAAHWTSVKNANNDVVNNSGYGALITTSFYAQSVSLVNSVIKAVDITDLQTKINQTRNVCICDSHCNCDPSDCGCNGECPSDDYYYYYYYYP